MINPLYQIGIEVDFENIYSFCKFTETALVQEKDKFLSIYKAKMAELTPEEKQNFEQFAIDIQWKLYDVFPTLEWTSVFAAAYSLFERHLNNLCTILGKDASIKTNLRDLKGQGIERAKEFLSQVLGIRNVFDSPEWNEIQNYSKVRNILMHASGRLDLTQKKHKQIFHYARNRSGLIVFPEDPQSDSAQITILSDYIYEALLCYRIFLATICRNETS